MRWPMRRRGAFSAALLITGMAHAGTPVQAPGLAVLDVVKPGRWQLHEIGSARGDRAICVRSPDQLLQLRHAGQRCARFVIDNSAASGTVHYTCPGAGHARTTIRSRSAGRIEIDTQGIAGGLPFEQRLEARRQGDCGAR